MAAPAVGDPAPGFTLPGTDDREYSLSSYLGQPVVLVFYPGDESPVCTMQLRTYSQRMPAFDELGAQVLGISPQDVASHERFAAAHGLRMPLLADCTKEVGDRYGILGPLGFYRRSVFVVDAAGVIRFARRSLSSLTYLDPGRLIEAVRGAQVAEAG